MCTRASGKRRSPVLGALPANSEASIEKSSSVSGDKSLMVLAILAGQVLTTSHREG